MAEYEPWYAQMQKEEEESSPAALAAKAAADRAHAEYLEKVAAYKESLKKPQSGWFNTDSSPFGRGRKGGRSRKSRTRRYRK